MAQGAKVFSINSANIVVCENVGFFIGEQVTCDGRVGEVSMVSDNEAKIQFFESVSFMTLDSLIFPTRTSKLVRLGPGLLGGVFDGFQNVFENSFEYVPVPIPPSNWFFYPSVNVGDIVNLGDIVGYVLENDRRINIFSMPRYPNEVAVESGVVTFISPEGLINSEDPVMTVGDIFNVYLHFYVPLSSDLTTLSTRVDGSPKILKTGLRVFDSYFFIPEGGSVGLAGGFATGKTALQSHFLFNSAVDIPIYLACGERGNEVATLLNELTHRTDTGSLVLLVNTSDMPALMRGASCILAQLLGRYYSSHGLRAAVLGDSTSRWGEGLRELASVRQEFPGEEGYPLGMATQLAEFYNSAGVYRNASGQIGSLTLLSSISPPGGDFYDPFALASFNSVSTGIFLSQDLRAQRHFPTVDWNLSFLSEKTAILGAVDSEYPNFSRNHTRISQIVRDYEGVVKLVTTMGVQNVSSNVIRTYLRGQFIINFFFRQEFLRRNSIERNNSPEFQYGFCTDLLNFLDSLPELNSDQFFQIQSEIINLNQFRSFSEESGAREHFNSTLNNIIVNLNKNE